MIIDNFIILLISTKIYIILFQNKNFLKSV